MSVIRLLRLILFRFVLFLSLFTDLIDFYIFLADDDIDLEGEFIDAYLMRNIRVILWNYSDQSEDLRLAITERQDMLGLIGMDLKSLADVEVNVSICYYDIHNVYLLL